MVALGVGGVQVRSVKSYGVGGVEEHKEKWGGFASISLDIWWVTGMKIDFGMMCGAGTNPQIVDIIQCARGVYCVCINLHRLLK